jgi:hypothetical protein
VDASCSGLTTCGASNIDCKRLVLGIGKLRADLEDAKIAATHFSKRAQYAAEDLLEDVTHGVKTIRCLRWASHLAWARHWE